jgi:viologen exporter family transport system ATP-binding protein
MPPAVVVTDLTKVYRTVKRRPGLRGAVRNLLRPEYLEVTAVRGMRFTLEEGEFVGFLGPNGAGKTTTLKMLAGLLYPSSGSATVLGFTPWERKNDYRRQIALVLGQKNQLWTDLPAVDSLELNRAIYEVPVERFRKTVGEMTELLGVTHRLQVQVRELSLGERMKFELIASLLHEPRVLFLDEPTIGLDIMSQQIVRDFLRKVNAERRTTIVLTSHNMADIKGLTNRVVVINHGTLVFDGPLAALVERWSSAKHLKVTASRTLTASELKVFGELASVDGPVAHLKVPREKAAAVTAALLAQLPVLDLTIEDPPIEDVITEVFRSQAPGSTP